MWVPWVHQSLNLNNVLFPAPLGPITNLISPESTFKETLSTAVKPPNFLVTDFVSKIVAI